MDTLKDDVVATLKAIVMLEKNGVLLKSINREFTKENGEGIPFKKLGYGTLPDFLGSIPEFFLEFKNGEYTLKVKANEKTAHMKTLISEQKRDKKRRKRPKSAPGRTQGQGIIRPSVKRTTATLRSQYKSTANLSKESPPLKKFSKPPQYPKLPVSLCTTTQSNIDVRGLPFVVVQPDAGESDKENCRELPSQANKENDTKKNARDINNITLKITVCDNKERKVQVEKISRVRFVQNEDECTNCIHPTASGYTLFGDDFFFDYATTYLDYPVSASTQSVGMCKRNISLIEASKMFHARHHFPKKIVILLGAIDIISGREFEDIAYDYYSLLNDVTTMVDNVVICTIPPLLNMQKLRSLLRVNALIECVPEDLDRNIRVIDLYDELSTNSKIKFNISEFYNVGKGLPLTFNEKGHFVLEKILEKYLGRT